MIFSVFLTNLNQPTSAHDGVGPTVSAPVDFRDDLRLSSHFSKPPVRIDGIALSKFINESSSGELANTSSLKDRAGKLEHQVQKAPASKRKRVKRASKAQVNAKIKQVKKEIKSLEQLNQLLERENKRIFAREAAIASLRCSLQHQQAVVNQRQSGSLWARRAEISKTHLQLLGSGNPPGNNRHHPDSRLGGTGIQRLLHFNPTCPPHPFVSHRPSNINRATGSLLSTPLHPMVSLALLLASSQSKLMTIAAFPEKKNLMFAPYEHPCEHPCSLSNLTYRLNNL